MKKLSKFLFLISWFLLTFSSAFATTNLLEKIKTDQDSWVIWNLSWWDGIYETIMMINNQFINIAFVLASIYFVIICIKLILADDSDSELWNFKKGFVWISIWLIVTKIASYFVASIFRPTWNGPRYNEIVTDYTNTNLFSEISKNIIENIVVPFINLLETWASFLFILVWIYAFFKLISSNWDEKALDHWKNTIFFSIFGFVLIKVASTLVNAIYGRCSTLGLSLSICNKETNISNVSNIIITWITWINSFVWIWVVIMIIYAWLNIIFSRWDEEKIKKWKSSILYITIGIGILVMNYLILTFFLPSINNF